MNKIISKMKSFFVLKFFRYSLDGGEYYFNEGYRKGWVDLRAGFDNKENIGSSLRLVPRCYRDDYRRGYQDGFAGGIENFLFFNDDSRELQ